MSDTMRFFVVDDIVTGAIRFIFRKRYADGGLHLERYDPATDAWVDAVAAVAGYLYNGEVGADEITAYEAEALRERLRTAGGGVTP